MAEDTLMKRLFFALLVIAAGSIPAFSKYSGGSGTTGDPYQIANVTDLLTLSADANDYNKCFIMTADIDLDPNLPGNQIFTTAVIAPDTDHTNYGIFDGNAFTGVFDGAGHKIANLTIDTNGAGNDFLGLFGCVSGGEIKNLKLENASVTGGNDSWEVGGLAGGNAGTINNCSSTGSIISGNSTWDIGGLVGNTGNIINSFSTCNVATGDDSFFAGGLTGDSDGVITNCFSTGNVSGGTWAQYFGGFMGGADSGSISNCYSTGTVNGTYCIGGFVGALGDMTTPNITNCYSTGDVFGDISSSGGFVGTGTGYTSFCYSTGKVCNGLGGGFSAGSNTSGCFFLNTAGKNNGYGTPLTDTQMKQRASFTGWNFTTIWAICKGTNYPRLIWQILPEDVVCPDGVSFIDYSFFAGRWMNTNCAANNNCDGTDFDLSGTVDLADLKVFCNYWLQGL